MKISELRAKLITAGCDADRFAIGDESGDCSDCVAKDDAYCLVKRGGTWSVVYVQRGRIDDTPLFATESADEACEYFYAFMTRHIHRHLVAFLKDERRVTELEAALRKADLDTVRNDIPAYNGPDDPRYRLFVVGTDVFEARKILGELPIKD